MRRRVIDNQKIGVADVLSRALRYSGTFDFVSAYFTIYGYAELMDELDGLDKVRFLYGDPTSVEDLDPGDKDPKSFAVTESGMVPNHTLDQKYLAKRCAAWVKRDSVAIRSVSQTNFLHGKMYLTGKCRETREAVVGSSNFTKRGLGRSATPNLEINLTIDDPETLNELQEWFDRLWKDKRRTEDVKQKVLDALARVGDDHAPELVYYKTLYELFRKDIDARLAGEAGMEATGFYDSEIWKTLYQFQKDGAGGIIAKLAQHNGCILADSVGLGKTYTALAVIKYYEKRNARVLVLCPNKLYENWDLYRSAANHADNPFDEDRFAYNLLTHTDLSRERGTSRSGINLATHNWSNYELVVIDESHNFRNSDGKRYEKLLEEIIKTGVDTKVLMLSATPVNTSLIDLRNQIYLMTEGRQDDYRESLGVRNISGMMATAQKAFKEWEEGKSGDKNALLELLGADFLRLLSGVSIARSRRHITESYADEMDRIGRFPDRAKPDNRYPRTDLKGSLSYEELANKIDKFKLSVYQPTNYVNDPARLAELKRVRKAQNFNQADSERFLVGMIRTNFLKRLESSAHSLTLTLRRTIGKIDALVEKIETYQQARADIELTDFDAAPDEDTDDEEFFVNRGRNPYRLSELDLPRWLKDLSEDKATLTSALNRVAAVTPERDGKLKEIKAAVRKKATTPTRDNAGNHNRKLLVFTTFKDTAEYLHQHLSGLTNDLGIRVAMVSGGDRDFNSTLTNFAPIARGRKDPSASDIDLLIATDCISEGQNLQDCDTVINYDIHWNPVRLIQRFGRIDRIGSRNPSVHMVNYWPTEDMDAYLNLESRVVSRMALADTTATGDENPLEREGAKLELGFRDQQMLRLQDQILDLDDVADSPVMSDFTLDHFLAQLLRYLEKNRDALEELPHGIYGVAEGAPPGVIFFLRQTNSGEVSANQKFASPIHPHYIVYVRDDGTIRFGCASATQAFGAFEAAAFGETQPITRLCDRFDAETAQGQNMVKYDKLLESAITSIIGSNRTQTRRSRGRRGVAVPKRGEMATNQKDFELVTWLVLMQETGAQ